LFINNSYLTLNDLEQTGCLCCLTSLPLYLEMYAKVSNGNTIRYDTILLFYMYSNTDTDRQSALSIVWTN